MFEPQVKLLSLCTTFVDEIRSYTTGDKDTGEFFRTMTAVFRQFRKQLHATIPIFDIGNKSPNTQDNRERIIDFSDSEDNTGVECMTYSNEGACSGGGANCSH